MSERRFVIADVFTDVPFGGNQLAVLPDGRGLDTAAMQRIAREFNFSETVFVLPPENPSHTRRLRIFTPFSELPFAGHPTVGAAATLASIGELSLHDGAANVVFEEGIGPIPVRIQLDGEGRLFAQLTAAKRPEIGPAPPSNDELAAAVSLRVDDLRDDGFGPQVVSCGVPFTFVPLRTLDAIRRARVNQPRWERTLSTCAAPMIFVFAMECERNGSHVHARMFAPSLGIVEDPATGAAAAALAGYLGTRDTREDGTLHWVIEQGFEMGRPSIIEIEADKKNGRITAVRVGGHSVIMAQGTIHA